MSISIRINTIITWYQFFIILIPTIKIKVNTKIFKRRKIGWKINSKKKIVYISWLKIKLLFLV